MKVVGNFLVALLLAETFLGVQGVVCKNDVKQMKKSLRKELYGLRLAHAVRLVFHDCVGTSCDGCIKFDDKNNLGAWQDTIRLLNDLYVDNGFDSFISYADYYVLAAIVAIEEGVKNANEDLTKREKVKVPNIPFKYGRLDCATAPISQVEVPLPAVHMNHTKLTEFYKDMFGFDTEETVAISGSHTLGGASGKNASGFSGLFKEDMHEATKFDNRYYQLLLNEGLNWKQVNNALKNGFPKARWQWEAFNCQGEQHSFMFQSDLATYLEASLDSEGKGSCGIGTCPVNAEGYSTVTWYANNYEDWLDDFQDAFLKMTSHGAANRLKNPRTC